MSVEDNPFRWVPSLKHISTVETIQMLWRNSKGKEVIKKVCEAAPIEEEEEEYLCDNEDWYKIPTVMIQQLEISIDELFVPQVLKKDLKGFMIHMIPRASVWLHRFATDIHLQLKNDWVEVIAHFIDNFSWNNIGFVDGRAMLKSYVRDKETIDFFIWDQLCIYFIEDDIKKFSNTIDWDNCKQFCNSPYAIYWYLQIYGKFPSESMFAYSYDEVLEDRNAGVYDEDNIIENMFNRSFEPGYNRSSATMYFCNHLKDDERLYQFFETGCLSSTQSEIAIYVLRTLKNYTRLKSAIAFNPYALRSIASFPCILLIDDRISVFETLSLYHFQVFFEGMACGRQESSWNYLTWESQEGLNITLYKPFEKLWTLFHRRFGTDEDAVSLAFNSACHIMNVNICKIMFDGAESERRKSFIRSLNFMRCFLRWGPYDKLAQQITEKILKDDEERKFFQEVWKPVFR